MKPALSRRQFLRRTAAAALFSPLIVSPVVLGGAERTSPNNRITVGFIGTGDHGIGWNLPPYLRHKDAQVVAVCDVDGNA